MITLIGDCPEHIRRDLQAIIARATELSTGNHAADRDLRDLASGIADMVHDYLTYGAIHHLREAMRSRAYIESEPERQMAMGQRWFATEGARL